MSETQRPAARNAGAMQLFIPKSNEDFGYTEFRGFGGMEEEGPFALSARDPRGHDVRTRLGAPEVTVTQGQASSPGGSTAWINSGGHSSVVLWTLKDKKQGSGVPRRESVDRMKNFSPIFIYFLKNFCWGQ